MRRLRMLYRDNDRAPYLYMVREAAARRGLDLELSKAELGGRYPEFLLAGETDVLAENYWGLQTLAAKGAEVRAIASAVCHLNEQLFVGPGIEEISDLAGKRVALRGVGPSELIVRLWLQDRGLAEAEAVVVPESEVGRWGQWKAVASGRFDAAFITNLHRREPLTAGLKHLPVAPYGFIGNVTFTTMAATIADRRADLQNLVAAAFEASRNFRTNEAATLEVMAREPKALMELDDGGLRDVYRILRDELSEQPVPTNEAIRNTHRMRLSRNPELADFDPFSMWNLDLAAEARAGETR